MAFSNLYNLVRSNRRNLADRLATPSTVESSPRSSVIRSPSASQMSSPSERRSQTSPFFGTPSSSPMRTPSVVRTPSVARSGRTATPATLPRTSPVERTNSSSSRGSTAVPYNTRKNANELKFWFVALYNPTSDYYGETFMDAGFSQPDEILMKTANTLPKIKKALRRSISEITPELVVDFIINSDIPPPREIVEGLTPEEMKTVYVTFERRRISEIGKNKKSPWSFHLKQRSPVFVKAINNGIACEKGKTVNPNTGRCRKTPKRSPKRSPKKSPKRSPKRRSPKKSPKKTKKTTPKRRM